MQYDSVHGCHSVCCVVLLPLMSCVKLVLLDWFC